MRSLLRYLFVENWLRKLISLILAIIIWLVVDQSLTTIKTVSPVGVRVINIPQGKTINGLQSSGLLNKRITLTITGKKSQLEDLSPNDLEVVLDASNMANEWVATIDKKQLVSLSPDLSIHQHISRVNPKNLIVKLVPLAEEKISVYVTPPIGEPPKGFQFLDVWPYHLTVPVKGPTEVIKRLKSRGIKLTFNLSEIKPSDIDRISSNTQHDVISFFVPDEWKTIHIPQLSEKAIQISDPDAQLLRIDLIRSDKIPLDFEIPVNLYVPPDHSSRFNPSHLQIANTEMIKTLRGIKVLQQRFYAKGVSKVFVQTIKDMLTLSINLTPKGEESKIDWSLQFINPMLLENRYISTLMQDPLEADLQDMSSTHREEYLRNRFRNYMSRFKLFDENDSPVIFQVDMRGKEVLLSQKQKQSENAPILSP